jgi:hypothetical protein
MTKAGERIIEGLRAALAYAKGDKSKGTLYIWHRCGCCGKSFSAPEGTSPIFCKKCDGKSE